MTNKKNKTIRLFAWFGAIVFAIVLAFMPFCFNSRARTDVTYADEVEQNLSFTSSYLPIYTGLFSSGNVSDYENDNSFIQNDYLSFCLTYSIASDNFPSVQLFGKYPSSFTSNSFVIPYLRKAENYMYSYVDSLQTRYFMVWFDYDSAHIPSPDIRRVVINSEKWGGVNENVMQTNFRYFDKDGNFFYVAIFSRCSVNSAFPYYYPERTYLFSNELSDNQFYKQGYNDGYSYGEVVGGNGGYSRGYDAGYSVGERTGFNQGVQDANTYSFLGLFGAIVDAPLSAFTGLFDFNLSFDGVHFFNLKGFFLAILSISLVIAIIRFAMSR